MPPSERLTILALSGIILQVVEERIAFSTTSTTTTERISRNYELEQKRRGTPGKVRTTQSTVSFKYAVKITKLKKKKFTQEKQLYHDTTTIFCKIVLKETSICKGLDNKISRFSKYSLTISVFFRNLMVTR